MREDKTTSQANAIGPNRPGGLSPNRACSALKGDGSRCKGIPLRGSQWCFAHHPDNRQKHAANGRRGGRAAGRGRPRSGSQELRDLRKSLADLADGVESKEISPAVAHAIAALANVRIRSIEVERKVLEAEGFEERVSQLEMILRERSQRG